MNWHNQPQMNIKQLFKELYFAQTEDDVDQIINNHSDTFKQENWYPLGGNENNFRGHRKPTVKSHCCIDRENHKLN